MERISNKILNYSDSNYKHAANYSQSLYNYPITLNVGEKHKRKKYILACGTSDNIELYQSGIFIYILSENFGLTYISLTEINTETGEEESIYISENDINHEENICYNILEMDSQEQIKFLLQYFN